MSKPKKPYYFKEKSDTYHWEKRCSKNRYPASGWTKSNTLPRRKRDQCNECKAK